MRTERPTDSHMRELSSLLRSRRARLQPSDVGLPEGGRRRTAGLRREEVAQLAAISPTYYTFLEQGRHVSPSHQVLAALADALRMDGAEREHLFDLARGTREPAYRDPEVLTPEVAELVDQLDPRATYVTGRRWDVLTSNKAARLLWLTDWRSVAPAERNMIWWTFADPTARALLVDWEREARALLARFRAAATRHPDDPQFAELIERLHDASAEVRSWWPHHDVGVLGSGRKRLRHPQLGEVTLRFVTLQVADDPEQKVVTFTASDEQQAVIADLIG